MFRFCDGFDSYAATADLRLKWQTVGTNWSFSAAGGVGGGGSVAHSGGSSGDNFSKVVALGGLGITAHLFVSFWAKIASAPAATSDFFEFNDVGGTTKMKFRLTTSGNLGHYSPGNSLLSNGSVNVCDNAYHHIEVEVWDNVTTARATLWIDGVEQFASSSDATTADFSNATTLNFDSFSRALDIDDVIVWDDQTSAPMAHLGVRTIETIRPNAAGDSAQFSPSAGNNHAAVDESGVHDGDTTYVTGATAGHVDLYGFADMVAAPTTITAVVVNRVERAATAGTANARGKAKSSSTVANGTTVAVSGLGWRVNQDAFAVDPNTAAAWANAAAINAAQFGVELVS